MLRAGSAGRQVLGVLKQSGGGLVVKELCQRLELSPMAVRRQLALLQGDRLIFSRKEKKKTGRPAHYYYLTAKGHECFQEDYANLAIELLLAIRSLDGKAKVNQTFQHRKLEDLATARRTILGRTLETRIHEVTQLLCGKGFMARWEKLSSNNYLIRLMNCPVVQVARRFPQTCICEEEYLSEVLQARVTRKHYLLHRHQFCSYLVEARDSQPGGPEGENPHKFPSKKC
ncbi:MAG: helix-turn-helix transcriptional regulator [Acidobacteriota bacterium]